MNLGSTVHKIIYILLIISLTLPAFATTSTRWWVFFKDKGNASVDFSQELTKLHEEWPPRSLARRLKSDAKLDINDLPVCDRYINKIKSTGATVSVTSRWMNAVSIEADSLIIAQTSILPFVKSIQPVASMRHNAIEIEEMIPLYEDESSYQFDYYTSIPYGAYGQSFHQADQAGVIEAHKRGYTGRGVFLGMLDTGFQLDHRAFAGMELIAQYDFINNDDDPSYDPRTDRRGQANHGSACLSAIAGYEPGRLVGIAPCVAVAVAKTEVTGSETRIEEDYWIAGIEWLEWLGVDVTSSSLSYRKWYNRNDYNGVTPLISRAARRAVKLGVVMCNSAGNEGPKSVTIGAPSDTPGVLAVAAVDSMGEILGFSSRGPSSDGRIKPDIAALGRGVVCIQPMTWERYARWGGTSLACPIVAGVATLVLEAHPDWPAQKVVAAMLETASHAERPDNTYGYGIVNAIEAIDYPSIAGRIILLNGNSPHRSAGGKLKEIALQFTVTLTTDDWIKETTTDSNGWFRFVNLPNGIYRLSIHHNDQEVVARDSLTVPPSIPLDVIVRLP